MSIGLLDEFIRMSEKIGQHFEKRPALENERWQSDFSQIHGYASLKEASCPCIIETISRRKLPVRLDVK